MSLTHWGLVTLEILVNTGSGNGLLADCTKPLPVPMLTYHQYGPVAFIWGHYHVKIWRYQSLKSKIEGYIFKITLRSPRGQWVKSKLKSVEFFMAWRLMTPQTTSSCVQIIRTDIKLQTMTWMSIWLLLRQVSELSWLFAPIHTQDKILRLPQILFSPCHRPPAALDVYPMTQQR